MAPALVTALRQGLAAALAARATEREREPVTAPEKELRTATVRPKES